MGWSVGALSMDRDELDVAALSLDELLQVEVTTPGKVPEAIRDTPASVYLVNRSDIEIYGYQSLTEIFENVPGFYNIDNYNGQGGNFGVRGYWNGRSQNSSLAILVNGVPQSRTDIWANPLEAINVPVEAIDRIEVTRGPNSVIYGNGASFGAINIITDHSFSDDQVTVSYGSRGTKRVSGRWSEFTDDAHVIVTVGGTDTDGLGPDLLDMASPGRAALLPGFGVADGDTSLDGRLERRYGRAQVSGEWKRLYFDFSHDEAVVEAFSGFPSVEGGNEREVAMTRLAIGADLPLSDQVSVDTRLMYSDYGHEERFDALYPGFDGVNSREYANWELESLLRYEASDAFRLLAGVNVQRMLNFEEFTNVPDLGLFNEYVIVDKRSTRSAFAQLSYEWTDSLRLVAGYRVEELKPFERVLFLDNDPLDGPPTLEGVKGDFVNGTPRFSMIYQPDEAHVFKLMVGDAVKLPQFPDSPYRSERTRTVEANYTWSAEDLMVGASVFANRLSDLLIQELSIEPSGLIDIGFRVGGRVDSRGVEFLVRQNVGETIQAELAATWQDSEDSKVPGEQASYSPEWLAHAKLSYRGNNFTASALGRYVGSMHSFFNGDASESAFLDDGYFGERIDDYLVFDLNCRWDGLWNGMFLSLHATNVFDSEIRYPNNPINGLLLDRGNLGSGRGFAVKAGFRF